MTSLLTNVSAMGALQTLSTTQRALARTQDQISSGLRVASAQDNAAYWSIGVGMKSQAGGLSAVTDGIALTSSIADVTASALVSIKTSLDKMQDDIVTARQPGVNLSDIQTDISAQQKSILDAVNSASFNGSNWLKNTISTNRTVDTEMSVSVSQDDWKAIARGQEPSNSFDFTSSVTTTDTANRNGVNQALIVTKGYSQTLTDAADGSVIYTNTSQTYSSTGDYDPSKLNKVIVPLSIATNSELINSSLSLIPLNMFSDYINGVTDIQNVYFNNTIDNTQSYNYVSPDPVTHSYEGYAGGTGILDQVIYLAKNTTTTKQTVNSGGGNSGNGNSGSSNNANASAPSNSQSLVSLSPTGTTVTPYVPSTSSGSGGSGTTSTSSIETKQIVPVSILTMDITGASAADLAVAQQAVQNAIAGTTNASAVVGAYQNRLSSQRTFNSALSDAITAGVGSLTDADMSIASTRLQALQTQQQLGIQSLSIANNNSSLIMKLFA